MADATDEPTTCILQDKVFYLRTLPQNLGRCVPHLFRAKKGQKNPFANQDRTPYDICIIKRVGGLDLAIFNNILKFIVHTHELSDNISVCLF